MYLKVQQVLAGNGRIPLAGYRKTLSVMEGYRLVPIKM